MSDEGKIMSMQTYITYGGSELGIPPYAYVTDISIYDEQVKKARQVLADSGANQIIFWWVGEHPKAKLVDMDNRKFKDTDLVCWQGPHLKVSDSGAILVWHQDENSDELWIEWEFSEEQS